MTHATGRLPTVTVPLAAFIAVLLAAACQSSGGSLPASAAASPAATPTTAATAKASTAAPVTPAPTAVPTATPAPSTACAVQPETGQLPSDRFTDIKVASTATADRLTFVFGDPSLPGPAGPAQGSLEVATPPYTSAGSGESIEMKGEHVVQIRFSGMSLSNDVGQETYVGPRGIEEPFPALRNAVIYDMSEGIVGWYVGYDGGGCVTLGRDGNDVTLTFEHQ